MVSERSCISMVVVSPVRILDIQSSSISIGVVSVLYIKM